MIGHGIHPIMCFATAAQKSEQTSHIYEIFSYVI